MSDTREKLIEVLRSNPDIWMTDTVTEMIADHLIANGVTFAKDTNVSTKDVPDTEGDVLDIEQIEVE